MKKLIAFLMVILCLINQANIYADWFTCNENCAKHGGMPPWCIKACTADPGSF